MKKPIKVILFCIVLFLVTFILWPASKLVPTSHQCNAQGNECTSTFHLSKGHPFGGYLYIKHSLGENYFKWDEGTDITAVQVSVSDDDYRFNGPEEGQKFFLPSRAVIGSVITSVGLMAVFLLVKLARKRTRPHPKTLPRKTNKL